MEAQPKKRMMIVCNWKSWGTVSVIKELCNLLLNKLQYDPTKIGTDIFLLNGRACSCPWIFAFTISKSHSCRLY